MQLTQVIYKFTYTSIQMPPTLLHFQWHKNHVPKYGFQELCCPH
ncbi:unnamed protein product [Linum tenue]|uniref:Uncharacterized protein n=1 Tax=Linum tenue TaxID=586396 RepID=A0AAV0PRL1_9ROSI|nr:unnamed protein product [Linum tenue]